MVPVTTYGTSAFASTLALLRDRGESDSSRVEPAVRDILAAVRAEGDAAVLRYVARFEKRAVSTLLRTTYDGAAALARLPADAQEALRHAAGRITRFHEAERETMFGKGGFHLEEDGVSVGLRTRAMDRVGVYAPGGKARYPSSVLMAAIPARVAGVPEIVLATPLSGDSGDDALLAAAYLAGVTAIVDAGGAQAIAALAYGTQSIPRVDKIVGPGNAYVACAKRLVYGAVSIDSIAGPSEILVLADAHADPRFVAADLLSQAEHDEDAYPLLACETRELADAVLAELERQLVTLPRSEIANAALRRHGHVFVVPGRAELAEVANSLAPEHLSLQVEEPESLLESIRHAGAVFLGRLTPEASGDYVAGPSHVLPTGGAVRFGSPLGVHDFIARTSLIRYTADALRRDERAICALARLEGLEAHARAVTVRTGTPSSRAPADGAVPGTESRS
ncbi:MAG: Histidinol dehydrogenase [Labilithrix sp.]|nr:Histidinol dehydrogenase [Labilithrix sp.]